MTRKVAFCKMHGTGNDYIYIDCLNEPVELSAGDIRRLSDRHFGVGGDGVVQILPAEEAGDFCMRMFNADGSEAEMCGNAVRCIGKFLYEKDYWTRDVINLETRSGIKELRLNLAAGRVGSVRVDMGEPILDAARVPVKTEKLQVVGEKLSSLAGDAEWTAGLSVSCISMGNPHAVIVVDRISDCHVLELGPKIENLPVFPAKTNVEFIRIINRGEIEMRVWERGSGETWSCGSGAAAVTVASALLGLTDRAVKLHVLGGTLDVEWGADNHVYKSGPAEFVFEGTAVLP